jgi:hypothetical protein
MRAGGRWRFSYQVATATWKSIYFAGRPGVLVPDTGLKPLREAWGGHTGTRIAYATVDTTRDNPRAIAEAERIAARIEAWRAERDAASAPCDPPKRAKKAAKG